MVLGGGVTRMSALLRGASTRLGYPHQSNKFILWTCLCLPCLSFVSSICLFSAYLSSVPITYWYKNFIEINEFQHLIIIHVGFWCSNIEFQEPAEQSALPDYKCQHHNMIMMLANSGSTQLLNKTKSINCQVARDNRLTPSDRIMHWTLKTRERYYKSVLFLLIL